MARPHTLGAATEQRVAQVRGVLAERVVVSTPLDPFLSLRALAAYSGLSVRKLRDHLDDPAHPLPFYRVGGKILVRRSEFDAWIAHYRQHGQDVDSIVRDVLKGL
jgi:excisionase family DNA binding protein